MFSQAQPPFPNLDPAEVRLLLDAAKKGFALQTVATVQGNVSVEAVLLPATIARKVFGKEVGDNYAAVELTVSNRSRDAALIVHSIYLDYSDWALSGSPQLMMALEAGGRPAAQAAETAPKPPSASHAWQATTEPNQISSVEYRIVRGEFLDAQQWTFRNFMMRALQAVGSVASAYAFSVKEKGIVRGIDAFNGQVIPAAQVLFPDSTTAQMNRISDVGFQTNKVIGKESSDIVVAFFPIDRFLTPSLKSLFLKSPAVFFAPASLLVDKEARKQIAPLLEDLTGKTEDQIRDDIRGLVKQTSELRARPTGERQSNEAVRKWLLIEDLMNRLSLNVVRIVVAGTMSVDLDTVPASITSIDMEPGNNSPEVWALPGDKKGIIRGAFLSGGTPIVANADALKISNVAAATGNTDRDLSFTISLAEPIDPGQKLNFQVSKTNKQNSKLFSMVYELPVQYVLTAPVVGKVTPDGAKLTISGSNFYSNSANELSVTLRPSRAGLGEVQVTDFVSPRSSTELEVDLSKLGLAESCWAPVVQVGTMTASSAPSFAVALQPSISSAKRGADKKVTVEGSNFLDLKACGAPLEVFYVEDKPGASQVRAENVSLDSDSKLSFTAPEPAASKWKVVLKVKGTDPVTASIQ